MQPFTGADTNPVCVVRTVHAADDEYLVSTLNALDAWPTVNRILSARNDRTVPMSTVTYWFCTAAPDHAVATFESTALFGVPPVACIVGVPVHAAMLLHAEAIVVVVTPGVVVVVVVVVGAVVVVVVVVVGAAVVVVAIVVVVVVGATVG